MTYTPKTFAIGELQGLSQKQLEVHLALYQGYVKHVNLIHEKIQSLKDSKEDQYVINELRRRYAFEFDGMRMHEYYFEQLEGGAVAASNTDFLAALTKKYGGYDEFVAHLHECAGTRGIGWVVMYQDPVANLLHTVFVADHELGQLSGLPIILAIDLWEHAFMVDYVPAEKKNYVDVYLSNVNWNVVEERFLKAT